MMSIFLNPVRVFFGLSFLSNIKLTGHSKSVLVTFTLLIQIFVSAQSPDISSATFVQEKDIFSDMSDINGLVLNNDGTKIFVGGRSLSSQDVIYTYDLSTTYDISTAIRNTGQSFIMGNADFTITANDLVLRPDGTQLFIVGSYFNMNTFEIGDSLYVYNLSTAFDVSSASVTPNAKFDISGEEDFTSGIDISSDGSKIFIIGKTNDQVISYDLSTNYDIATGTVGSTKTVSTESTDPESLRFSADGLTMWVLDTDFANNTVDIFTYTLSIAFDVTTASYIGSAADLSIDFSSIRPAAFALSDDESKLYVAGTGSSGSPIWEYDLPSDVTPPAFTSSASVDFVENGTEVAYNVTANEPATFTLGSSKDEDLFILANANEISFISAPDFEVPLDADGNNSYQLVVIATDAAGNVATLALTINVTDVFDGKYSGGTGILEDPFQIANGIDLRALSNNTEDWGAHFIQVDDIIMNDQIFAPIGTFTNPFMGSYDGQDFSISNLAISAEYAGLFGFIDSDYFIRNLSLVGTNVVTTRYGGILASFVASSTNFEILNVHTSGSVSGDGFLAGLVGSISDASATITKCTSVADISGGTYLGGLIGSTGDTGSEVSVSESSFNGTLTGVDLAGVGGLIGICGGITRIQSSFNSGRVQGFNVGGLIGEVDSETEANSSTDVSVSNSYNQGDLFTPNGYAGGIISFISLAGKVTIDNCYHAGIISTGSDVNGGIIGRGAAFATATINNSFYDIEANPSISSDLGGIGLSTGAMQYFLTYLNAGWDMACFLDNGTDEIWTFNADTYGDDYPVLAWEITTECDVLTNAESEQNSWVIYPNPSPSVFRINTESSNSINRIVVYNTTGKLMLEKEVINATSVEVELSGYPSGTYYIKIYSKKEEKTYPVVLKK